MNFEDDSQIKLAWLVEPDSPMQAPRKLVRVSITGPSGSVDVELDQLSSFVSRLVWLCRQFQVEVEPSDRGGVRGVRLDEDERRALLLLVEEDGADDFLGRYFDGDVRGELRRKLQASIPPVGLTTRDAEVVFDAVTCLPGQEYHLTHRRPLDAGPFRPHDLVVVEAGGLRFTSLRIGGHEQFVSLSGFSAVMFKPRVRPMGWLVLDTLVPGAEVELVVFNGGAEPVEVRARLLGIEQVSRT